MNPSPSIVPPGKGRILRAYGDEVQIQLGGEQTGGKFTLFIDTTPPGSGPPPHYHVEEDETFHVLEGNAEFFKDGQWIAVPAGTTVYMPKGTVHSFRNAGDKPLKQLIMTSPAGFEIFFAKSEAEFQKPGGPDMQRILAIAKEHDIHFVHP